MNFYLKTTDWEIQREPFAVFPSILSGSLRLSLFQVPWYQNYWEARDFKSVSGRLRRVSRRFINFIMFFFLSLSAVFEKYHLVTKMSVSLIVINACDSFAKNHDSSHVCRQMTLISGEHRCLIISYVIHRNAQYVNSNYNHNNTYYTRFGSRIFRRSINAQDVAAEPSRSLYAYNNIRMAKTG